jgi:hypothetical protein
MRPEERMETQPKLGFRRLPSEITGSHLTLIAAIKQRLFRNNT